MLHLAFSVEALPACLIRLAPGDTLILLDEAATAALADSPSAKIITEAVGRSTVCVLQSDLENRNLASAACVRGVRSIQWTDFVALTAEHHPAQSWF